MHTAPKSLCPVCGRLSEHARTTTTNGIHTAWHLCVKSHAWSVQWVAELPQQVR